MRRYEMMFLMSAALPDDDRQAVIDRVMDEVEDLGGEIARESHYDVRDLAYTIEDADRAAYHLIRFWLDGQSVQALKDRLNLVDDLLRFLIVHLQEQDLAFTGSFTEPEDKDEAEEETEEAEDIPEEDEGEAEEEASDEETSEDENEDEEAGAEPPENLEETEEAGDVPEEDEGEAEEEASDEETSKDEEIAEDEDEEAEEEPAEAT